MYRRSNSESTTPLQSSNSAFRGKSSYGGGGAMKQRSTSSSNFGFRSNLQNSGGMPIAGDSSGKRNVVHGLSSSVRPIGAHCAGRATISCKDPRLKDVANKEYQQFVIEALVQFLEEINCPLNVTDKILISPTLKQFTTIFETMYKLFDPQFKVKNVFEDIPAIFKLLGYPFQIQKSTLQTVSAPNSLQARLLMLNWLRELAQAGLNWDSVGALFAADEGENVSPTEPSETLRKTIFEYNVQCYSLHRSGDDNFEAQDQYMKDFISRLNAGDGGLEQVHAENDRLLEELKMLESSGPERDNLLEECQRIELDLQKMTDYLSKTDEFHRARAVANAEIKAEVEVYENDIKDLRREVERKEAVIAQQDISPSEVKRMTMAKHDLHSKIRSLAADGEQLEKRQYQIEMDMHKDRDKIDRKMVEFKQKSKNVFASSKLDLDPIWMEYLDFDFSPFDPKFGDHYKERLRPGVDLVIQMANKAVHDMQGELVKHKETVESIEDELNAAEEEIQNVNSEIKEADEKILTLKQGKSNETDRAKLEIQRLKLQYDELASSKKMSHAEKEQQAEILTKERNEKEKKFKAEVNEWTTFLTKELDLILAHQQFIVDGEQETTELLQKYVDSFSD